MASPSKARQRIRGSAPAIATYDQDDDDHVNAIYQSPVCLICSYYCVQCPMLSFAQKSRSAFEQALDTPQASAAIVGVLTAIAFALRFYKISQPDQVV